MSGLHWTQAVAWAVIGIFLVSMIISTATNLTKREWRDLGPCLVGKFHACLLAMGVVLVIFAALGLFAS